MSACAHQAVVEPGRTPAAEHAALLARVTARPADGAAWRDLGWGDLLDGDRAAAAHELGKARAILPHDARVLLGLATLADEAGRFTAARDLWLEVVEHAAKADGRTRDPWLPLVTETALASLRMLVGEVAGEAELVKRLAAVDVARLPVESRLRVLGLKASLARLHGDEQEARRLDVEQGCPTEIVTAGPYGVLPRLDLARLDANRLDEARSSAPGRELRVLRAKVRGCSFEIATPLGEPGVGAATLWARAEQASTALVSIDSGEPWRLTVDGKTVFASEARDRYAPRLRTLDVPLDAGWHRLVMLVAAPGPRTDLALRIAGPGVTLAVSGPSTGATGAASALGVGGPTGAAVVGAAAEAKAHQGPSAPSPASEPDAARVVTRLTDYLELLRAFREGDGDAGERSVARLVEGAPSFVAGLLAAARVALEDPSRPSRFARDRARRLFERALALNDGAVRARYGLAVMDVQDEKPDKALELLAGYRAPTDTLETAPPAAAVTITGAPAAAQIASTAATTGPLTKLPADAWRIALARYEALRARGWHVEAEQALAEARAANPEACAPLDAVLAVAREKHDYRRARDAASALVKCAPESDELAGLLREAGAPREAAAEYRRLLAINPGREPLRAALAEVLLEAGQRAEATALLTELVAGQPRNTAYRCQLADALVDGGDDSGARRALAAGLLFAPESEELRRALHALGEPSPVEAFRIDGKEVIAAFERSGRSYDSPAVILLDRTVTRVFPTGARLTLTHNIVRVQNKDGIDKWGEVTIPEGADVLVLRTVKADGSTREPEQIAEKKSVSVPDLAAGDYVEFEYLDPAPGPGAFPGGFMAERFFFQSFDAPLDRTEYVLATPAGMRLQLDARGQAPEAVLERRDGLEVRTFRDRQKPQLVPEAGQTPFSEYVPSVRAAAGASFDRWRDYLDDLQFGVLRANPELRQLAEKLRASAAATAGTHGVVEAVDEWVRQNVKHGGPLDEAATSILTRGEGNRVTLERALLAAAGVRSNFWLVRPPTAATLDGALPDLEGYDEPVLAARVDGEAGAADRGPLIVDPRFRHAPTGFIAPLLRQAPAFAIAGRGEVSRVRVNGPRTADEQAGAGASPDWSARRNADLRSAELDVELAADGSAEVKVRERLTGWFALEWREGLDRIDEDRLRAEFEQRTLGFYFPGASLTALKFEGRELDAAPFVVEYSFHAPRFAIVDGKRLVVPAPFPALLGKRYVGIAHRATPLQLVYTAPQEVVAHVHLPEGAKVVEASSAPIEASGAGRFAQAVKIEDGGRALRLQSRFMMPPDRVAPERYDDFVRFAYTVDKAQERAATIELR